MDGRLELGYFYEGKEPLLICDVGRELECDAPFFGDDIVIRFRRLRSLD